MTVPATLFDIEPLDRRVEGATIQERFESFHALNPWVYRAYESLTGLWLGAGHKRIGMKMLTEVIRWQYGRQTTGDHFKLNDHYTSRYVRMLLDDHPEWREAFELRELRTP